MSRQGRRTASAIATVAALAAGIAAPEDAGAAGSLAPVDVSAATSGGSGGCGFLSSQPGIAGVDVASNARGDTIVSWTRNNGGGTQMVQAAFRPAGGSFGAPQDVGLTRPCYFLGFGGATPDVELDGQANAVIVFPATAANGKVVVRAALKPAGGPFGAPFDLSNNAESAGTDPSVAMNAGGAAVAVWSRFDGAKTIVQASSRAPGGAFAPAADLSAAGQDAKNPRVALNDDGAAAVAWVRSNGTVDIAQARVRPSGQAAFAPVQDLSASGPAGQDASAPDLALDPAGRATVVWVRNDGTQPRVQSRFLTPAGAIGAGIDDVSDAGDKGSAPNVAVDPSNTAVAVFGACPTAGGSCTVKAAARPSNGSFGNVDTISPPSDQSVSPKVVLDRAGVATAVISPFTSNAQILMTRRPAGGTFGAVQPISPAGGTSLVPALAVDDEGNVLTGWTFTSSGPQVAQVSAYDAGPPSLAAVSVPGTGDVGSGVGMAAAATDRWSPVSIKWSFGDGASAAGDAVTHAFGSRGDFDVSVAATDAVGNASSATRPILIGRGARSRRKRIRSSVLVTWGVSGKDIYLLRLKVKGVPKRAKVQLRCKGKGCPYKRKASKKRRNRTITLFKAIKVASVVGNKQRSFRAGQRLEVRITKRKFIGKVVRYKLQAGKIPSGRQLCLRPGGKKPRRSC
jgi:hypothetical protein